SIGAGRRRKRMSWGAVAGAAVGVVGGALTSDKGGGAGASSSSNEPWANAQPWLVQLLNQGYGMQQDLQNQPFSPQQQTAYDNQFALSDYGRDLIPSLLGQMQNQPVGFDKNNRDARPQAWNWGGSGGLLGGPDMGQKSVSQAGL